ncbi:UNVERIFIED_CONTAM: hypothetical protein HDU68_009477 [Siphonaria sp. JEL0065]|nr:hypothetical protein HDU68_009477 [Siphonaria sp. JEL0065]
MNTLMRVLVRKSSEVLDEEEEKSWLEKDEEFDTAALTLREILLADVVDFPDLDDSQDIMVIFDNVNAIIKCIKQLGPRFRATQDIIHLMMRATSKVKASERAAFAKSYSVILYIGDSG